MSLLDKMCEELGIKIGEEWIGSDGYYYRIKSNGKLMRRVHEDRPEEDCFDYTDDIGRLLLGTLEPIEMTYEDMAEEVKKYYDLWQEDKVRYAEALDTANGLIGVDFDSIGYIRCFDELEFALRDIENTFGEINSHVLDYFFENDIFLHHLQGGKVLVVKYNY